ncbi:hypothetical protein GOBAR_DD04723 [Gossypium barbadense]|nr:hypothetical protein GOBAR_DD04723 [Gossypium barbadense]
MPFISKIQRQTDYNRFPPSTPIVIDNGASYFRIGWAGETEPRVIFRNIVQRPRHKSTGETVTIVGDHDPALLKYFDCTRSGPRSAFDSNVVFQFEIMEYILDFAFDRLGANGSRIDHPILITECVCNPVYSCSKMAELLFETYGVRSVAFGVDAAFSYEYNQLHGICEKDGLAICPGFTTTHVIPFVDGEPVYKGCCRTNIGGYHITDYLKQLLSLKYPHHMARFTWEKVEDLKMEHCYIAPDYALEAQLFQVNYCDRKAARKRNIKPGVGSSRGFHCLPMNLLLKQNSTKGCYKGKARTKIERNGRSEEGLEFLLQQLGQVQEEDIPSFLSETGSASKQEIELTLTKVTQSLRKAKGEPKPEQAENEEKADSCTSDKYPLINVPDNMLTPEQLKEKKRQIFLKTTTEGRQRAKQKRVEEELERERKTQQDEERRLENPQLYLKQMHTKYKELYEKIELRKRLKTNGGHTNGSNSGGVGRGERLDAAQRERMRLLTTAAFDRGKGEDTFELARVSSRLQEIDSTFVPKLEPTASQPTITEVPHVRPLTKEDFQIVLGVERFRCPEILFHPNLVGIDQVGLDEMTGVSIRRLPSKDKALENRLTSSVFMTGGCSLFPGINERLEAGIRMLRPCGSPIKVARALDPVLDAWRGASLYAANSRFHQQTFSRADYYEKGEDWLRRYQVRYTL